MKLERFVVKNYRSCLTTNVEPLLNLTCLIGINGAGKSNILNSLLLFKKIPPGRHYYKNRSKMLKGSYASVYTYLMYNNKQIQMKFEFQCETDEKNMDVISDVIIKTNLKAITNKNKWIVVPPDFFEIRVLNRYFLINRKTVDYYWNSRNSLFELNKKETDLIFEISQFLTGISYYSASQFSDPSKCPVSFELEEARGYRVSKYQAYHERFLNELYTTFKDNKKLFEKFISLVNAKGIGLIDTISFGEYEMPSSSYEVRSGGKIKKIDKSRQLIIPSVTIDQSQLSFNQLSEGTFKTLALIFYIITDKSKLLLIEEPEVCVHHGLLNSIISLIINESKQKQIIISTHSDFVLDRLKPENIILVTKVKGKGTLAKGLQKSMSKNDYQALKDYLLQSGNLGEYWKEGGFSYEY